MKSVSSEPQIIIFACLTKQLWKKDNEVDLSCVQEGETVPLEERAWVWLCAWNLSWYL